MLVQVTPNLILNPTRINYVEKIKDNRILIQTAYGECHRVDISMSDFMTKINGAMSQFLSEDA